MADLLIRIKSKFDGKGFKEGEKSALNLGSALKGLAAGFAFKEVIDFGRESLALAQEQAKAEGQVAAAIASTGGAAGMSLAALKAHAGELQNLTNFGDEATLAGQGLLLTFTSIGSDVFPRATSTMLDMSTALGQDLKSSAIQLGKALNDPVEGVNALRRVGVSFTDSQRDMIKSLVETGKLTEAQTLILDELNKEFGGSAEAAREADGGFTAVANSFGDLREELGFLILDLNEATNATGLMDQAFQKLTAGAQAWQGNLDLFRQFGREIGKDIAPTTTKALMGLAGVLGGEELQGKLQDFAHNYVAELDAVSEATVQAAQTTATVAEEETDKLLDIKRDLASDLLDEQRQANDELAELAKSQADDLTDAEEDAADRIGDIRKRAAKDRLELEKDLKKDLENLNKDLGKSLEKQQLDEEKQIARVQQQAGRDEIAQRKRKEIDTLADERLFQFELRKLAAEGDGIAIRDALERRAIEEEIAREKAEVEKEIEQDKKQDQVASIRQEGQERREQLRLDNSERAALLQEQHQEEAEELGLKLAEDLRAEAENYTERRQELAEYYNERQAAIAEGEAEGIAEIATGLATARELTQAELANLAKTAFAFGEQTGSQFAGGLASGFGRNAQVDAAVEGGGGGNPLAGLTSGPLGGLLPSQVGQLQRALNQRNNLLAQGIIDQITEAMQ